MTQAEGALLISENTDITPGDLANRMAKSGMPESTMESSRGVVS